MATIDMATINSLGAVNGARTRDPWLGKPMLYQLSYYRNECFCLRRYNFYFKAKCCFDILWCLDSIYSLLGECFATLKYFNGLEYCGIFKIYEFDMFTHSEQLVCYI